jgi:NADH:ubiquinone oxidoreductase subunit 2 (subunit N)
LVGFERKNKFSTTSSITYLILASIPSGFFILGVALLYHNFGSFSQDYLSLILNAFTNNTLFEVSNNDNDNNFRYF